MNIVEPERTCVSHPFAA